jgi:hypothetical protein
VPRLLAPLLLSGAFLTLAAPGQAALGISAGAPATFTNLAPGATATATSSLTVTSTELSWTLKAQDTATLSPGRMDKLTSDSHCATGDTSLDNALELRVAGAGGTPAFVALSGTPQTVASGVGILSGLLLTTTYRQVIPSVQRMAVGCPYVLTTTYTLSP